MLDAEALRRRTRAVLESDRVTLATRRVLSARLDARAGPPQVLAPGQMRTLSAVAARLIPLDGLSAELDLAAGLDAQLASGSGDGWRYAALPPDRTAVAAGLDALDGGVRAIRGRDFAELAPDLQDAALDQVQRGRPEGPPWPFPPELWFEEVLASLVRLAYAHPMVQVAIGYDGFADAHGVPPRA